MNMPRWASFCCSLILDGSPEARLSRCAPSFLKICLRSSWSRIMAHQGHRLTGPGHHCKSGGSAKCAAGCWPSLSLMARSSSPSLVPAQPTVVLRTDAPDRSHAQNFANDRTCSSPNELPGGNPPVVESLRFRDGFPAAMAAEILSLILAHFSPRAFVSASTL